MVGVSSEVVSSESGAVSPKPLAICIAPFILDEGLLLADINFYKNLN